MFFRKRKKHRPRRRQRHTRLSCESMEPREMLDGSVKWFLGHEDFSPGHRESFNEVAADEANVITGGLTFWPTGEMTDTQGTTLWGKVEDQWDNVHQGHFSPVPGEIKDKNTAIGTDNIIVDVTASNNSIDIGRPERTGTPYPDQAGNIDLGPTWGHLDSLNKDHEVVVAVDLADIILVNGTTTGTGIVQNVTVNPSIDTQLTEWGAAIANTAIKAVSTTVGLHDMFMFGDTSAYKNMKLDSNNPTVMSMDRSYWKNDPCDGLTGRILSNTASGAGQGVHFSEFSDDVLRFTDLIGTADTQTGLGKGDAGEMENAEFLAGWSGGMTVYADNEIGGSGTNENIHWFEIPDIEIGISEVLSFAILSLDDGNRQDGVDKIDLKVELFHESGEEVKFFKRPGQKATLNHVGGASAQVKEDYETHFEAVEGSPTTGAVKTSDPMYFHQPLPLKGSYFLKVSTQDINSTATGKYNLFVQVTDAPDGKYHANIEGSTYGIEPEDVDELEDWADGNGPTFDDEDPQHVLVDSDSDEAFDTDDVEAYVEDILQTLWADINLDGEVTSSGDGAILISNLGTGTLWSEGDLDHDGDVEAATDGAIYLSYL